MCYPYGVPDLVQRWDFVELPKPKRDEDGFLIASRTRIARTGPQTYQNADGSSHVELRLPEDVGAQDALRSISSKPITVGHPGQVRSDNAERHAVGAAGVAQLRDEWVEADLTVWADRGIQAAENGHNEISLGYQVFLEPVPGGTFQRPGHPLHGTRADFLQRQIRVNHIALVDRGRANQGHSDRPARLRLDAEGNQTPPAIEAQEHNMEKITINGQTFEVSPEVAQAIRADAADKAQQQRQTVRNDSDSTELQALKAEKAKADARADAAEAKLKAEQDKAKSEETLAAKRKADAERIALVVEVAKITDSDAKELAEQDADALRVKAIEKLSPDLKLDGKSTDYIHALYDHLTAQQAAQGSIVRPKTDSATEIQRAAASGQPRKSKEDDSPLVAAAKKSTSDFYSYNPRAQKAQ